MIHAIRQAYPGEKFARAFDHSRVRSSQFRGQQDVFLSRERGNQLERLKDETDFSPAHLRHAVFGKAGDIHAIQNDFSAGGAVESGEQSEQSAFAASGRAHDGGEFALGDHEIDAAKNFHFMGGGGDGAGEMDDFDDGARNGETPVVICGGRSVMIMAVKRRQVCNILTAGIALGFGICGARAAGDSRPVIVAFGDSLTAGYGVSPGKSYPDDLQRLLDAAGYKYRVVNLGVSGDTTTDGLQRLPDVLAAKPAIVILEFGGNDGLRGLPVSTTRTNLSQIVQALQKNGIRILLAGMTLPRNYGETYIHSFEQVYTTLASQYHLARIPFLLEDVAGHPDLVQPDEIHPTAEGCQIVSSNVIKYLTPLLKK